MGRLRHVSPMAICYNMLGRTDEASSWNAGSTAPEAGPAPRRPDTLLAGNNSGPAQGLRRGQGPAKTIIPTARRCSTITPHAQPADPLRKLFTG